LFVPHQANQRILQSVGERLGMPSERIYSNVARYGNTMAGSIPLALDEAVRAGRIQRGQRVLLSGFGAGLSWGSAIVQW
jgi:3-oxoacyl-[acyl-carrier-protein] synthase-3